MMNTEGHRTSSELLLCLSTNSLTLFGTVVSHKLSCAKSVSQAGEVAPTCENLVQEFLGFLAVCIHFLSLGRKSEVGIWKHLSGSVWHGYSEFPHLLPDLLWITVLWERESVVLSSLWDSVSKSVAPSLPRWLTPRKTGGLGSLVTSHQIHGGRSSISDMDEWLQ